ncbi:hypothetical protein HNQ92_000344 [Rhabdobacter roseus]|uniref:Uncharacterized protein n=1 Tax=Rhabdobacter roseus TaxID=1655419 RepID=A0A840TLW2_9BACT|nr:hypothetical protein [Rhabdobacter roseus]MBB5282223.1 hypothetical protein [Rhabdobacter roseus]
MISERAARAADILESIEELNKMIAFHRDQSKDSSMQIQYETIRQELLKELATLLALVRVPIEIAA